MSDRGTCWSITINNPKVEDYQIALPAKWSLEGQLEKGEQGTEHYQGMLNTPQVRFSAVKRVFPRAHIELARNKIALAQYVHKEETRLATVDSIPTLFEYQTQLAGSWNNEEFSKYVKEEFARADKKLPDMDDLAMDYLDTLVAKDIEAGLRGIEFIAINPMWRSSWKKFWRSIIKRHGAQNQQAGRQGNGTEGSQEQPSPGTEDVRGLGDSPPDDSVAE